MKSSTITERGSESGNGSAMTKTRIISALATASERNSGQRSGRRK